MDTIPLLSFETCGMLRKKNHCSFELCTDLGALGAFFPGNNTVMLGPYKEVSCSDWSGSDGKKVLDKLCMAGKDIGLWPNTGCSNSSANHSPACIVTQF